MFRKITGIAIVILLVLLFLELALRGTGNFRTYSENNYGVYASGLGEVHDSWFHSRNPNDTFTLELPEFSYFYQTNSFGHRETEIDSAGEHLNRVFVFGDSFTEGMGAPYDSTWPRFLEHHLLADSLDARVYICGTSGSDPFDSYMSLKHLFLKYQPSHVMVTFNTTDIFDYVMNTGFKRFRPNGRRVMREGPWWQEMYRYSHLVRAYVKLSARYDESLFSYKDLGAMNTEALDSITHCLQMTAQLCDEHNIKFMAVTHSGPLEICIDDPRVGQISKIEEPSYEIDIVHLNDNIKKAIEGEDCLDYAWLIDGHFNSRGYQVFADELWSMVNEKYPDYFNRPGSLKE